MQTLIDFIYSGYPKFVFLLLIGAVGCFILYTQINKNQNPLLKNIVLTMSAIFAGFEVLALLFGFQYIGTLPNTLARYLVSPEDRNAALATCPDMFSGRQVVEGANCKLAKKAQAEVDNNALFESIRPNKNDPP